MSLSNKEILAFVKKNIDLKKVDGKIVIELIRTDVDRVSGRVNRAGSVGSAKSVGRVNGRVDSAKSAGEVEGHVGKAGSVGSVVYEESAS